MSMFLGARGDAPEGELRLAYGGWGMLVDFMWAHWPDMGQERFFRELEAGRMGLDDRTAKWIADRIDEAVADGRALRFLELEAKAGKLVDLTNVAWFSKAAAWMRQSGGFDAWL